MLCVIYSLLQDVQWRQMYFYSKEYNHLELVYPTELHLLNKYFCHKMSNWVTTFGFNDRYEIFGKHCNSFWNTGYI